MSNCYGPTCEECPLYMKAEPHEGINMGRDSDARFLIVTDAPIHRERDYNRLMQPGAMTVFSRAMQEQQFAKDEFAFWPQVRCVHDPDEYTTKEKTLMQKCCRPHFKEAVKQLNPEVIIPLGSTPAKQVFHRGVQITKIRGVAAQVDDLPCTVLPMLNPLQAVLYPQHLPTINSDAATLGRLVDFGYDSEAASEAALGNYEMIDDLQFLIDANPAVIAYDTENTGLRWYAPDAKILTMQFCIEPGVAYLLPWDHPDAPQSKRAKRRLTRQLQRLLGNPRTLVVGQNAKYDCTYTRAHTGVHYRVGGCTLNLEALIDENSLSKNLDDLTKKYVPSMAGYADAFNAAVDKSRMAEVPLDKKFVAYGCGDVDACYQVFHEQMQLLHEDPRLLNLYEQVTLPGLNAFASIELRGMYVDEDEVEEFEAFMAQKVEESYRSLLRQVPKSIKRAHVDKGLSFSRRDFLLDILFYHEDGLCLKPKVFTKTTAKLPDDKKVPSTSSKDHLPYFFDDEPFTFELAEYVKMERVLSTNVRGFKNKYIVDGMVRPIFNLHKTVTGRSSSEDPNGQNYPKRGPIAMAYRKIFVAPEGYVLLEADLSQAELRIAGDMANDPTMIKIYQEAGDIHTATALIVMGISEAKFKLLEKSEQKLARTKAKAVNFGFLYGMGWKKFIAYAKTQYGVEFSEKESKRIRAQFFTKYHKLPEWHQRMRDFAHEHKMVRSFSGRVRHLPMIDSTDDGIRSEAERQAINSPVQEFGSTLGVMAMGRMESELDPEYFQLVGFVHDAIYAYVKVDYLEWGAKTLKWYMESNDIEGVFGKKMKCPIVADVGFGLNLGEVFEMGKVNTVKSGRMAVNEYDFDALWEENKMEEPPIDIPRQRIPPNHGRLAA